MTDEAITVTRIRPEFIYERDGKPVILYAGILNRAHEMGMESLNTDILQYPGAENGQTTIVHARATMPGGKTYDGIGDANPSNVTRAMLGSVIRMAETRAKGRALRDATNIGMVVLEEFDDAEGDSAEEQPANQTHRAPAQQQPQRQQATSSPAQGSGNSDQAKPGMPSTPAQVRAIYLIARNERHLSDDDVDTEATKLFGQPPAKLTKRQASEFIDRLRTAKPAAAGGRDEGRI